MAKKYFSLRIVGLTPDSHIWLSDEDGNLVQHERGVMHTSLLPGTYFAQSEPRGKKRQIDLMADTVMELKD